MPSPIVSRMIALALLFSAPCHGAIGDGVSDSPDGGWTSVWMDNSDPVASTRFELLEKEPLRIEGKSYLKISTARRSDNGEFAAFKGEIYRKYDQTARFDPKVAYSISFLLRVDRQLHVERHYIADTATATSLPTADASWLIMALPHPDESSPLVWGFSAAKFFDSGGLPTDMVFSDIQVRKTGVYSFQVIVDPVKKRCQLKIEVVTPVSAQTGPTSFASAWMDQADTANSAKGMLRAGAIMKGNDGNPDLEGAVGISLGDILFQKVP